MKLHIFGLQWPRAKQPSVPTVTVHSSAEQSFVVAHPESMNEERTIQNQCRRRGGSQLSLSLALCRASRLTPRQQCTLHNPYYPTENKFSLRQLFSRLYCSYLIIIIHRTTAVFPMQNPTLKIKSCYQFTTDGK